MKKLTAVFLLMVILFNIAGYRLFFYCLTEAADARMESKIEKLDEFDKRLITIKIPINLPYQTDWKYFEPVNGEIAYKGVIYKYVKQKVHSDTLILLCLNHREKSEIENNSDDYFKKVNDLDNTKKPIAKQAKVDFYQETIQYFFSFPPVMDPKLLSCSSTVLFLGHLQQPEYPPEQPA